MNRSLQQLKKADLAFELHNSAGVITVQHGGPDKHHLRSVVICTWCGKLQTSAHYARHLRNVHKESEESIRMSTSRFKDRRRGMKQSKRGEYVQCYSCPQCRAMVRNLRQHRRVVHDTKKPGVDDGPVTSSGEEGEERPSEEVPQH